MNQTDERHMLPPAEAPTPLLPPHEKSGHGVGTTGSKPPAQKKPTRWVLLGLLVVAIGGFVVWNRVHEKKAGAGGPGGAASANPDRTVPVGATAVVQKDMPIYLEGLGSVLALATVQVRPQVDGRLDAVLFKEGQFVKKGDVLAQVDPRPFMIQLHTAQAAVAKDSATLRDNKLNLDRYVTLRKQNLIAQQQQDDQQALVDQTAASVQSDQAMIESAKLNLDWARIVSPVDGITGVRNVDPGNIVHASDTTSNGIVIITQMDPIAVLFTLPEDDLSKVYDTLQKGPIAVEAYSRDGNKLLSTGKLLLVDNQINQATASIRLKATFANPDRKLWPNEFVKTRLLLTTRKNALVVPAAVVQRGPSGTFAYVVNAQSRVDMVPITVEVIQGDTAIISKGLTPGQQVVVDGQNQLKPGSKVLARAPELSSSAAATDSASPPDPSKAGN
jgi:multidrug efflux system membrane fusion protein